MFLVAIRGSRITIPVFALLFVVCIFHLAIAAEKKDPPEQLKGRWKGTLHQFSHDSDETVTMILNIGTVSHGEFSGSIEWPDNNSCITKITGKIGDGMVKWTEEAYISGDDVILYGLYVAKYTGGKDLSGDWMDPEETIYPAGPDYGTPGASFKLEKSDIPAK